MAKKQKRASLPERLFVRQYFDDSLEVVTPDNDDIGAGTVIGVYELRTSGNVAVNVPLADGDNIVWGT